MKSALVFPRAEIRIEMLHFEAQGAVLDGHEQELVEDHAVVAEELEHADHRARGRRVPDFLESLAERRARPIADEPGGILQRRARRGFACGEPKACARCAARPPTGEDCKPTKRPTPTSSNRRHSFA
jgi:hypothetical protein